MITIFSIASGFLALCIGAFKDFGGYSDDAVTLLGITLLAIGVIKEYITMYEDTAPRRARAKLSVVILAAEGRMEDAGLFAVMLLSLGYKNVRLVNTPDCCDGQTVIVFQPPTSEAVSMVDEVRNLNPLAHILVYSFQFIQGLKLSNETMGSNSTTRLLGDLATIAEMRYIG